MAADDDSSDLSALAWPGFVDILSAVVIMFVFFVMIVATALYFHTMTYKAKVLSESQAKETTDQGQEMQQLSQASQALEKQIEAMQTEKEVLERVVAEYKQEFYQAQAEFNESEEQEVRDNRAEREVLVFFGSDAISVTEDTKFELLTIIDSYLEGTPAEDLNIVIEANKNPALKIANASRQLAVARMLNARNVFLESVVPKKNVSAKIVDGGQIEENYNWVRIRFK